MGRFGENATVVLEELELASSPSGSARSPAAAIGKRVRATGGGRKRLTDKDATLLPDLDPLVEPTARGGPMAPRRGTYKAYAHGCGAPAEARRARRADGPRRSDVAAALDVQKHAAIGAGTGL